MSEPLPEHADQMNAAERLAVALGRPVPRRLTAAEKRELEARLDRTDEEAARFYAEQRRSAA
jgi:hypothetical protein